MQLLRHVHELQNVCPSGSALCLGVFDGVHLGHRMLLESTVEHARSYGLRSLAFTFSMHPLYLLAPPYAPPLLTDAEEKADLIRACGIDLCLMLDFTPEFAATSPQAFLDDILAGICHARHVVCGRDFHFGARGAGDITLLKTEGARLGYSVDVRDALVVDGHPVKSTRIRQCLFDGQLEQAAALLGRHYTLRGMVVEGDRRGRTIGYPTANLVAPPERLVPPNGVYAVRVALPDGEWGGMLNIGRRPTFAGEDRTIEAHLFDFDGDLYGRTLQVHFVRWLRPEQKFPSVDALREQLRADEATCREILTLSSEAQP